MPAVTIRNLSEEIYQNIKLRAVKNGRSAEAEIRHILKEAVSPASHLKIGSELAAFSQKFGPLDIDFLRKKTPLKAAKFE